MALSLMALCLMALSLMAQWSISPSGAKASGIG